MRRDRVHFRAVTAIAVALVAAGFAMIGFAWSGAAARAIAALQLPYAVSGGLGGLLLVGVGARLVSIQVSRAQRAREARELDEILDAAGRVLAQRRSRGAGRVNA